MTTLYFQCLTQEFFLTLERFRVYYLQFVVFPPVGRMNMLTPTRRYL